jgi:polyisoprenoid-binding protein YceI
MRHVLATCAVIGLAACSQPAPADKTAGATPAEPAAAPAPAKPAATQAPAGAYVLDGAHTSLVFRVSHLGLSHYTARFKDVKGELQFNPADPAASSVTATIDPRSLDLPSPPAGFLTELLGPQWLDAAKFPKITFTSTQVEVTGPTTARITGDLSLHGVTRPVTLDATFNGGYQAGAMDPDNARVGFSAKGVLQRAPFGVAYGVPAPGSNMGVSDDVEVMIETEFTRPGPPAKKG